MSVDTQAVEGEATGWVPCLDAAAAQTFGDDVDAVYGDGEGYVPPTASASAEGYGDDVDAVSGDSSGYVPAPCVCVPSAIDGTSTIDAQAPDGWYIEADHGVWAFAGDRITADFYAIETGFTVFRFIPVQRALVLAGLTLKVRFGYVADREVAANDTGADFESVPLGFTSTLQVQGATRSLVLANANDGHGLYSSSTFVSNLGTSFDWPGGMTQGDVYTLLLTMDPAGSSATLVEGGFTYTRPLGFDVPDEDPLSLLFRLQIGAGEAAADGSLPYNQIHAWIGDVEFVDPDGNPVVIPGVQDCPP